jgi:hypothetical protein
MLNKGNMSVLNLLIYVNPLNNSQQKPCFGVIVLLFHRLIYDPPIRILLILKFHKFRFGQYTT